MVPALKFKPMRAGCECRGRYPEPKTEAVQVVGPRAELAQSPIRHPLPGTSTALNPRRVLVSLVRRRRSSKRTLFLPKQVSPATGW
jgi:hypothetical protein